MLSHAVCRHHMCSVHVMCVGADSDLIIDQVKQVPALQNFPPGIVPLMASYLGPDSIVVCGGIGGKMTRHGLIQREWKKSHAKASVDCYSLTTQTWRTGPRMPRMLTRREGAASVVIGNRLLVFGGRGADNRDLVTCEAFDPVHNRWSAIAPMLAVRRNVSAVEWQGRAFLFGRAPDTHLFSGECYDPKEGAWTAIAAPTATVAFPVLKTVAVPGRGIFIMQSRGGCNPLHIYHPDSNAWTTSTWTMPAAMRVGLEPITTCSLHCLGSQLFCILHGSPMVGSILTFVLDFDDEFHTWSSVSSVPSPFSVTGIVSVVA